jgi:hypothetical protein
LWLGTICFFVSRTSSTLLRLLAPCSSFMCHFVSNFPHFCAEISSFISASLGGERQRVWNFRGVCHCRDVAQGSDRMISLYLYPGRFYLSPMLCHCAFISGNQYLSSIIVPV